MKDKNPKDFGSIEKDKSWNSNYDEQRLGFINRDMTISQSIPSPIVQYPLGRPYAANLVGTNPALYTDDSISAEDQIYWQAPSGNFATDADRHQRKRSIPGILSLQLTPIMASGNTWSSQGQADIFINKWTQMRILNNMTENFQPGDLQFVTAALMHILMHVANARRALRIMQTVVMNSESAYFSPESLLGACGWHMSERTMRQKYFEWMSFFNRSIIGNLNNVVWLKDVIPGLHRWESLMHEVYKDTSADTPYCQLYVITPGEFYHASQTQSGAAITWEFTSAFTPGGPVSNAVAYSKVKNAYWNYHDDEGYGSAAEANRFEAYLRAIYNEIRDIFYDSSTMNIIATLNAISQRTNSTQVAVEQLALPELTLDPEPIKLTWDFKMMLAIHNATITPVATTSCRVDPESGLLKQNVVLLTTNENIIAGAGKVMNLPCFGATNSDIQNALQWCVMPGPQNRLTSEYGIPHDPFYNGSDVSTMRALDSTSFGTDVISSAYIFSLLTGLQGLVELGRTRYVPISFPRYKRSASKTLVDLNYTEEQVLQNIADTMIYSSAFAFAPLIYQIDRYTLEGSETPNYYINCVSGQLEVVYDVDYKTCCNIHNQWSNNFWGYPVVVGSEGTPQYEATN